MSAQPTARSVDSIGFPANYQNTSRKQLTQGRGDCNCCCIARWVPYPYRSTLLFESWSAEMPVVPLLFVQKKDRGFVAGYGQNRNGEWVYVAYRPDGSYQTLPNAISTPGLATTSSFVAANSKSKALLALYPTLS